MGGEEAGTNPYKELDKVYHHVISSAVEHSKDASDPNTIRFRKVVGAIVSVLSPMSATTLGNLIGKDTRYIKAAVNHLRSVIIVPTNILSESEPLRVFHLSFPNYLTERCSDPCFAINPVLQHLRLAIDCLNTLNAFLRTNICELPNPLALNHEVPDLQERLSRVVLPHYRYACQNWAFHLEASSQLPASVISTDFRDDAFTDLNEEAMSALTEFCQKKLILWLEVLVLLGWLDKSISAIKAGMKWVKTNWPSDFSINLLDDVRRMVQRSFSKMKLGGSHVYSSGLAFMPDSALYEQYKSSLQLKVLRGRRAAEDPCLSVMKEHSSSVYSVAFSHDSTQIISSNGNSVCIWDASTGTLIKNLEGHTNYVLSVAFSHDSTQIVSSSNDMTVRIWDAVTGSLIKKLEGHTGSVFSVAFSHDSMQIVSGSTDTTVCTWDVDMGSLIWKLEEHTGFVQSVAFSHDSTHIASGSNDTTVCIWDTDSGSLARKLKGHTDGVMSVAFSHDSTRIVSGSWDSTVCIWDAATGSLTKKLEGHTSHIRSVAFSHDSMQVVSGSDDHSVCVWDASTASLTKRLEGHLDSVMSVEFSHDSTQIISGSCDKTVWVWDAMAIDTGSNNNQLQQHVDGVFCMALSHDETYIASGSVDNTIGIWNLATGSLTEMLQYTSSVISIAFSYGGMQIVSGSSDHTVCIWDIFTGSLKRKLEGHTDTVMSVALSCDDTWIVSGSYDHMVLLWDVQTGSLARRLQEHIFRVLSVTFSHNSAQVLSGSEDMTVCIWDVASGSLIRKLEGHDHYVEAVAFSHNSMHIVSGSYDSAVYIWDAVNGSLISRLRHTGPVYSVEFSGNGLDVAVYDRDGQGSIWRCPDLLHSSSSTQKQLTGTSSADKSSGFILSLECNQIIHISSTGCRTLLCCLPDVPAPVSSCSGVFGIIQKGGKLAFVTASRDFYILDFTSLIDAYIS
ncbi:hypothetical protein FRC03_009019 [Tulasnella sp. 419]|nr:hypothetical protein FRC03_009019 [Tulasnella sp. 419]